MHRVLLGFSPSCYVAQIWGLDVDDRNLFRHDFVVSREQRSQIKGHSPRLIWLTGLSGSGKSTIAGLLERELNREGVHTYLLDGDHIRHGLCRDLGFTPEDRRENIRRAGETAKLLVDAGLVVIASFISPYRSDRTALRALFAPEEFVEVFVDCKLEVCEERDPKGLYRKAREGKIKDFTGVDAPYERPENPELRLDSSLKGPEESVAIVMNALRSIRPGGQT